MKLFLSVVYIRIITLTMIFNDHPLVEYPLSLNSNLGMTRNKVTKLYTTKSKKIFKCKKNKSIIKPNK